MAKVNLIVRKAIEKGLDDGKSYRKIAKERSGLYRKQSTLKRDC